MAVFVGAYVVGLLIFRYISVDDSELFYYFIESEGNPQEDPLFLWLTGGPGCTAFSGLIYEVGIFSPLLFSFYVTAGYNDTSSTYGLHHPRSLGPILMIQTVQIVDCVLKINTDINHVDRI